MQAEKWFSEKYRIEIDALLGKPSDQTGRSDPYRINVPDEAFLDGRNLKVVLRAKRLLRFSNSIRQLTNMILIARNIGAEQIIVPNAWFLKGGLTCDRGIEIINDSAFASAGSVEVVGDFFYLDTLRPVCELSASVYDLAKGIRENLAVPVYPPLPGDVLVIYIRSGDIFEGENVHRGYGQPPLAFYKRVVTTRRWAKVMVVYENISNPVIEPLLEWLSEGGYSHGIQSGSLVEDIGFLLSASTLVAGRGTFIPGITALSSNVREVFFFDSLFTSWGAPELLVNKFIDVSGEYRETILGGNWANSEKQRQLMVRYDVESVARA